MEIDDLIKAYNDFQPTLYKSEKRSALLEPVGYILALKSKRIRPLLTLIAYQLYNNDIKQCLHAAYGLELFHNFTLMHDDIMDQADLRRGQASTHIEYGTNEAIISGDAMAIMSYEFVMHDCPDDRLREILKLFNKNALDICVGQQLDMEFEQRPIVSTEEYIEMIRLKTAVFLGMALQIGAILGGADAAEAQSLFKYGESLGIAFQIQDDLLDLTGDSKDVGKIQGGDIYRNKKTILISKAIEIADESQNKRLTDLLNKESKNEETITDVIQLFKELNLFEMIESEISNYFKLAEMQLDKLKVTGRQLKNLNNIASMIQSRKS